uniref:Calpain catalytic domain-containing protein n=1 Tax=Anopheles minimus TaxID=112268 RepID=A0A182W3P1_9DIPT
MSLLPVLLKHCTHLRKLHLIKLDLTDLLTSIDEIHLHDCFVTTMQRPPLILEMPNVRIMCMALHVFEGHLVFKLPLVEELSIREPSIRIEVMATPRLQIPHLYVSCMPMEKAYAKLYGGYTFLKYGTVGRALQDLTGAVVQSVPPSGPLLGGAVPRSTLLIAISGLLESNSQYNASNPSYYFASSTFVSKEKENKRRRSGLLTEHPYCVTGLARVRANSNDSVTHGSGSSGGDTSLIRLRSPWIGGEWGGVWCGTKLGMERTKRTRPGASVVALIQRL